MAAPRFSIIIPTFNRAGLIRQTLDSVLQQSRDDLEIIVVDDGSTDTTCNIIRAEYPAIMLLQQANRGPGAARNLGLRHASGDYAAFLDSDDLWFPWTLHVYSHVIDLHQPAFIAGKPIDFKNESEVAALIADTHTSSIARQSPPQMNLFRDYFSSGDQWRWYSASCFVMRRELLLARGGFPDEWVNAEDADAALQMGDTGTFVQITQPVTFAYRQHANSAMANLDRTLAGINRLVGKEQRGEFPGGPERAWERRRIITTYSRPLCLEMLNRQRRDQAWQLFRQTERWNRDQKRWRFLLFFRLKSLFSRFR